MKESVNDYKENNGQVKIIYACYLMLYRFVQGNSRLWLIINGIIRRNKKKNRVNKMGGKAIKNSLV